MLSWLSVWSKVHMICIWSGTLANGTATRSFLLD